MPTVWDTTHGYPYLDMPGATAQQETGPLVSPQTTASSTITLIIAFSAI